AGAAARVEVADVGLEEGEARRRPLPRLGGGLGGGLAEVAAVAGGEVVERDDGLAEAEEVLDEDGADEAGGAGDEPAARRGGGGGARRGWSCWSRWGRWGGGGGARTGGLPGRGRSGGSLCAQRVPFTATGSTCPVAGAAARPFCSWPERPTTRAGPGTCRMT